MSIQQEIGLMLRELRKSRKVTLEELAAHLGVQHQTIYKYEKGQIKEIPQGNLISILVSLNADKITYNKIMAAWYRIHGDAVAEKEMPDFYKALQDLNHRLIDNALNDRYDLSYDYMPVVITEDFICIDKKQFLPQIQDKILKYLVDAYTKSVKLALKIDRENQGKNLK